MAPQARSKYRAVKETVGGIAFHSKAEARRYGELKLLERSYSIRCLTLQPRFQLCVFHPKEGARRIGEYVADFQYEALVEGVLNGRWERVIEDVKGVRTPLYLWKKKHVEAQYGVRITEIHYR